MFGAKFVQRLMVKREQQVLDLLLRGATILVGPSTLDSLPDC